MIINFSVENFGSIKDKQTLSFLANKSDHLEEYYIIEPIKGLRLNKLALIYGANASGKTTVLKALDFLRKICIEPFDKKTSKFDFEPFLFDELKPKQNTKFELEFVQNRIRYFYEVELNKNCIVKEKLLNFTPNKAIVFERNTDQDKELTQIKFGSKISKKKAIEDALEIFTLWNNTVLGGFLKTNIDNEDLENGIKWFSGSLDSLFVKLSTNFYSYVTSLIEQNKVSKHFVLNTLKKADFNIIDFEIDSKKEEIPDFILELLRKEYKENNLNDTDSIFENGIIERNDINFLHNVNNKNYRLDFDLESSGTKKYYELIGFLGLLIENKKILLIDEIESTLHPDLFIHFLLTYLVNGKNESQLIATTHNREILNNRDLFRDDAIWFTDKDEDSATELYSLADFDTSVVRDTSNVLNAYKAGKLGGVPSLGDYYIDLEDGK